MQYFPILRHSNAEMNAYRDTRASIKEKIIPVIEGRRLKESNKDQWNRLFNSAGRYLKERVDNHTFIYDFKNIFDNLKNHSTELKINNINPVEFLIEKFQENKLNFIPCFNHDSPEWLINSIAKYNISSVAVRIRYYDLEESLHNLINNYVMDLLNKKFPEKNIYLILDFKNNLNEDSINNNLKFFQGYSNVILSTTSLDEKANVNSMSFKKVSDRKEVILFRKFHKVYPNISFSDYTTRLTPEPDNKTGFNMNNSYLKIFYTTDDGYYLGKSKQFDEGEPENFQQVCELITKTHLFSGENYTKADFDIKRCAQGLEEVLTHQKTIELSINHHLRFTVDEL